MKRDVSIQAVENGWLVRDASHFLPSNSYAATAPIKGTWVFNSTSDLARALHAILETEAGPKPVFKSQDGIADYRCKISELHICTCPKCIAALEAKAFLESSASDACDIAPAGTK